MSINLENLQNNLGRHFSNLAQEKKEHGYVVYAIEHGLTAKEVEGLCDALNRNLKNERKPKSEYWLAWVVVATEVGYDYDGDEYWASFSERFPDWNRYGSRTLIRRWFQKFAKNYNGFYPSGPWADHFKNIAWPISHSVLPKYLQTLFAIHLHELRFDLSRYSLVSANQVGDLLRCRYHGGSSRFEKLLEETELTGSVLIALRDEDMQEAISPIQKQTIARIISDLEAVQATQSRFKDARRILREARVRASRQLTASKRGKNEGGETKTKQDSTAKARMVAKQTAQGEWKLGVAFPDLSGSLEEEGISLASLDKIRVRMFDQPNYWVPGRNIKFYFSRRELALNSLPSPIDTPLLVLEQRSSEVIAALANKVHFSTSDPWVLRIHNDGVARQILSKTTRSGESYLIVTLNPFNNELIDFVGLQHVQSQTNGAYCYCLNIPARLTVNQIKGLERLGLGYSVRAKVEPVGLVPRREGQGDASIWLTTETPMFQLSADFPVQEFWVKLDDAEPKCIPTQNEIKPIITLSNLETGMHTVCVQAESSVLAGVVTPEVFNVEVREPKPWKREIYRHAGFRVSLSPSDASFQCLLNQKACLAFVGPEGRLINIELYLSNSGGHILEKIAIGHLRFPVTNQEVIQFINKLNNESILEKVNSASFIEIRFSVEELGVDSVSFSNEVKPLRWKLERFSGEYHARLINEADSNENISVDYFSIKRPDRKNPIDLSACLQGTLVAPPGGLYVANYDDRNFPVVTSVPEKETLDSFAELGTTVSFGKWTQDAGIHIPRLLERYSLWKEASILGPLGSIRTAMVLEAFEKRIGEFFCGAEWIRFSYLYLGGQGNLLETLCEQIGGSPGFRARIRSTDWGTYENYIDLEGEFVRLSSVYRISENSEISKIALRLAFCPHIIELTSWSPKENPFDRLLNNRNLARGAYLVKFIASTKKQGASLGSKVA